MREDLKYNLASYLQKKNNYSFFVFLLFFLFLVLFVASLVIDTYNITTINAETNCEETCEVVFYWPVEKTMKYDFIKINDKRIEIENLKFGEIELNNTNTAFQKIALKGKEYKGENNEIVKVKIFQNKEKIIKKIGKIIIERET